LNHLDNILQLIPLSAELLQAPEARESTRLKIWVNAYKFTWHSFHEAVSAANVLQQRLNEKYPFLDLVLEITVSEDIYGDFKNNHDTDYWSKFGDFHGDGTATSTANPDPPPAVEYALARTHAFRLLQKGDAPDASTEDRTQSLPAQLLKERRDSLLSAIDGVPWTAIYMYGPPGVGKTKLAINFGEHLRKTEQAVTLMLSHNDFPSNFTSEDRDVDALLASLITSRLESRLPNDGSKHSAHQDIARRVIAEYSHKIVLLIDEVDHLQKLRDEAEFLLRSDSVTNKGIRFVIVSRGLFKQKESLGEHERLHEIYTFDRDEAKLILRNWVPEVQESTVTQIMEYDWIARMDRISLYMLRLIAASLDTQNTLSTLDLPSGRLLQFAIEKITKPLEEVLRGETRPDPALSFLERAQELLPNHAATIDELRALLSEPAKVDAISLLGNLAWHSKYTEREAISVSSLTKWSEGMIPDEKTARSFIERGTKVGLFLSGFGTAAVWNDQFVADGCAAIKIQRETNTSVIAEMAMTLERQNAAEILGLAPDYDAFRRIVEACLERQAPVKVLDGILSRAAVARLVQAQELFDFVNQRLLDLAMQKTGRERYQLCRLLARLAQDNEPLRDGLLDHLQRPQEEGKVAAETCAMLLPPAEYERHCENLGVAGDLHVLSAAAMSWPADEGERLVQWCKRRHHLTSEKRNEVLKVWWDQRAMAELPGMISKGQQLWFVEDGKKNLNETSLGGLLASVMSRRNEIVAAERSALVGALLTLCTAKVPANQLDELMRVVARFSLPEMPAALGQWRATRDGRYMVPSQPMDETALGAIFGWLRNLEEENSPRYRLTIARYSVLQNVSGVEYQGWELVGDNIRELLEAKASGQDIQIRTWDQLRVFDGNTTSPKVPLRKEVPRDKSEDNSTGQGMDIGSYKFKWRPMFELVDERGT